MFVDISHPVDIHLTYMAEPNMYQNPIVTSSVPDPFNQSHSDRSQMDDNEGSDSDDSNDDEEKRLARLKKCVGELEITASEVQDLRKLEGWDIVCIADDSGSMNEVMHVDKSNLYDKSFTRWADFLENIKGVLKISMALDGDGVDCYFLNRPPCLNVKHWRDVKEQFERKPHGHTPLTDKLEEVMNRMIDGEKRVLIIIGTDGEPDDGKNGDSFARLKRVLLKRNHHKFFISIMACSDQPEDIRHLNNLDQHVKHLDVSYDFLTEKRKVLHKGIMKKFTRGDYVAKVILGPILPNWHKIDGTADKGKCVTM